MRRFATSFAALLGPCLLACGAGPSAPAAPPIAQGAHAVAVVDVPPPAGRPETHRSGGDEELLAPTLTAREREALREVDRQIDVALRAPCDLSPGYPSYGWFPQAGTAGIGTSGAATAGPGGPSGGTGLATAGATVQVQGPSATGPTPAGTPQNAGPAVAGTRAAIRRCYDQALKSDPNLHASLGVDLTIRPDGTVERADVTLRQGGPIPTELSECIAKRFTSVAFAPVGAKTSVTLVIRVVPPP